MKLISLALIAFLTVLATSTHADDLFRDRDHLFPEQVAFEVSIPFGGSSFRAVEFSLNYNNFDNISTRNVVASFNRRGDFELPQYNAFGEDIVDWAIDHPWWASGIAYCLVFGIPNF